MVEPGAPGQVPAKVGRKQRRGIPKGQGVPASKGCPPGSGKLPGEGVLPGQGILPGAPGQVHRGTEGQLDKDAPNPWAPDSPSEASEAPDCA